jgi:hypothetical protein
MAIRHSMSGGRSLRNRLRSSLRQAEVPVRLRGALTAFLESERDALVRAYSLLKYIAQAMELSPATNGPYYPDVIELAAVLLKPRTASLDDLLLGFLPAISSRPPLDFSGCHLTT